MNDEFLLIVDGSSLLSTQFYGNLPPAVLMAKTPEEKEKYFPQIMQTSTGVYTNGIFGLIRYLLKILRTQKPSHLAVAWDLTRETFRRRMYPEYKANRTETIAPLRSQFALAQDVLRRIGVKQFMSNEFEADDFSGTLTEMFQKEIPVRILTKDHDYLQLASDRTTIWLMQQSQKRADELFTKYGIRKEAASVPEKTFPMNPERIRGEYGVAASSIAELKGLQGDASDNIKGVPGIGEKTAVSLIAHYKTVDALYDAIHKAGKEGEKDLAAFMKASLGIHKNPIGTLLKEDPERLAGEQAARLSRDLATIRRDIPITETLADLRTDIDYAELSKILQELEIKSISLPECAIPKKTFDQCDIAKSDWEKAFSELAADTSAIGIDLRRRTPENCEWMTAFGIVADQVEYTVAQAETVRIFVAESEEEQALLAERIANLAGDHRTFCFGAKQTWCSRLPESSMLADVGILDYLLRPLVNAHEPADIVEEWMPGAKLPDADSSLAGTALAAGEILYEKLVESGMETLFTTVEMPLTWVLRKMQDTGIAVDRNQLHSFAVMLATSSEKEKKAIWEMAGKEFNINSPKQLSEVLFETMGLKYPGRKPKSGYSTSADVLEKMKGEHPIVEAVLRFRQYSKLYSTYAEGLTQYIDDDGRIRCRFRQTVTATGRLSSTEPNLQNIPARTELGRDIRKAFVPKEGCVFVDADYSQIELRLMAHFSGDESLIEAYRSNADIHRLTASEVFHVPMEEVSPQMRSAAKAVNFGIIYGIGAFSLGQDIGVSRDEAQQYIDRYFARFPKVKQYLDETVAGAKKNGFVKTAFGRVRPIPELSSNEFAKRAFGERVAMNSPIQGTAADIMKIAMIAVDRELTKQGLRSKILLQVHDELLLEVPKDEETKVAALLQQAMEHAAELSVPLTAEVHSGENWLDAK